MIRSRRDENCSGCGSLREGLQTAQSLVSQASHSPEDSAPPTAVRVAPPHCRSTTVAPHPDPAPGDILKIDSLPELHVPSLDPINGRLLGAAPYYVATCGYLQGSPGGGSLVLMQSPRGAPGVRTR
jgi:hypothetical protein